MIHIYDEDNIDSITYLSGERRQKSMRILTYVPRLLLVPVITLLDIDIPQEKTGEPSDQNPWQRAYSFVNNREIDARDVITIKWQHLSAEPSFIEAFYRTEFRKASFSTENASTENEQGLLFHKGPVDGTLRITDRPEIDGTDLLVLTIHLPHEK
jgi:hypothetical protein